MSQQQQQQNQELTLLQLMNRGRYDDEDVLHLVRQRIASHPEELRIRDPDDDNRFPLHRISTQDDENPPLEMFETMVHGYPEALCMQDAADDTPLHLVCWFEKPQIVQYLLWKEPKMASVKGNNGFVALPILCMRYIKGDDEDDERLAWMELIIDVIRLDPKQILVSKDISGDLPMQTVWKFEYETSDLAIRSPQTASAVADRTLDVALVLLLGCELWEKTKTTTNSENGGNNNGTTMESEKDNFLSKAKILNLTAKKNNEENHQQQTQALNYSSPAFSNILHALARHAGAARIPLDVAKQIIQKFQQQLFMVDGSSQHQHQQQLPTSILKDAILATKNNQQKNEAGTDDVDDNDDQEREAAQQKLLRVMETHQQNLSYFMLRMHPSEVGGGAKRQQ